MNLRAINPFRRPSPQERMAQELEDARLALLDAQTGRDYANSMVQYHESRIDRLRAMMEASNDS